MTLFFTGHRGFLGRELIPMLARDYEVVMFDGDLSDFKRVDRFCVENRVDKIIHAAVRGGRRNKIETPQTLIDNLSSSLSVVRTSIPALFFCSGAVYDRNLTIDNLAEDNSNRSFPSDYYGQSKFIVNQLAQKEEQITMLRFFNVFGPTEGLDRFISFNIQQYIQRKPMVIFKDFYMDFFYVGDAFKIVQRWMAHETLPKELNLVYTKKLLLSEVCRIINSLDTYDVPIKFAEDGLGKSYTGNSSRLNPYLSDLQGLENGINSMYQHLVQSQKS
jgi:nucleoside-diphosphate-sugar epimerase